VAGLTDYDRDSSMRMAAFEHVRRLNEIHDHLTANELKPGYIYRGERIPLVNPRRGIFKPQQMRYLLSIKTVFPKPLAARFGTTTNAKYIARSSRG
jgi:putative restriction endonuclease